MTRAIKKQKTNTPIANLGAMLESCRPANTQAVQWFIDDWLIPLGGGFDGGGNYIVRVGDSSRVMWSSHTDTVHNTAGRQRIVAKGDRIQLANGSASSCLGADCSTGVWLMREMILADVAGLYVFHDSEEVGGIGSGWLAKNHGGLLDGIDFCIAFDRKGTDSIITHQFSGRTASDKFADSMAKLLPFQKYRIDTGGTFTDSASYVDVIGECTNLSVGYYDQHTKSESQSISHALAMRTAMIQFDETKLIASRKAGEIDPYDFDSRFVWSDKPAGNKRGSFESLQRYVRENPESVAAFLDDMGINSADLYDFEDSFYRDSYYGRRA